MNDRDVRFELLENIKECYPELSKGQKKIASFILENYIHAAYMTAAVLARETGVSESTDRKSVV